MKAIRIHAFGGPEVLKYEEAPRPVPKDDEVLIKVYASGVNPVDWRIREGQRKKVFPSTFPLILGWDVSGIIEEKGKMVKNFTIGDEVYSKPDPTQNGTYAEYVAVKADQVARKPSSISHVEAASVPLAGLTAWQALFTYGQLRAGQKVLVHAASGGVGTFAVQFAKWKGAYVIGTTSGKHVALVKELGVDRVVNYEEEAFESVLQDLDLVVDTLGGEIQKKSLQVLKQGGRLISTLQVEYEEEAKKKNIHIERFTAQSIPADLDQIAQLIDEGKVKPVVTAVMPLEKAAEAQRMSQQGHVQGKIVLQVIADE